MITGLLLDFYGHAIHHAREKPSGGPYHERDRDDLLPVEGWATGMRVSQFIEDDKDPVCLYDRWGHIIYQWPDEYVPSLLEVKAIIQEQNES